MRKALLTIPLLLVLAWACAFGLRMSYADIWVDHSERATFNGTPLLLNMDGYFYLRVAKQIQQGTYDTLDEKSVYPQGAARRSVPPLLSSLTAWLSSAFTMTLEHAALLLPAIVGSLVVIPVFFLGRAFGGPLMGFLAALFTGLAPGLIQRSAYGFFDTDGGNVFFAATCAMLFMQFGLTRNWKRYLWFLGGMLAYVLYLLWWDQTIEAATALAFLPFLAALVVDYRPPKREALIFLGAICILVVVAIVLQGHGFIESTTERITRTFSYLQKESQEFPSPSLFVGEQKQLDIASISSRTMGSIPGLVLSLVGLVILAWKLKWRMLYVAGFILTGVLAFQSIRFIIFLVPLLSLGFACLFVSLWNQRQHQSVWRLVSLGALVLVALLQTMSFYGLQSGTIPASHPGITQAMAELPGHTPERSLVWTNWNLAYPLMFYAERATIVDGQSRTPMMNWVVSVPYASTTQRQSANWIQFYAVHGTEGLDQARILFGNTWTKALPRLLELLAMGPESARISLQKTHPNSDIHQILSLLYPEETIPLFIFMDHRTMHTFWYTLGQWNFSKNSGSVPYITLFTSALIQEHSIKALAFSKNSILAANLDDGIAKVGTETYPLSQYAAYGDSETTTRHYRDNGYALGVNIGARGGALSSPQVLDTTFYELFIEERNNGAYFRKVFGQALVAQCWEVHADHYSPEHDIEQ